MTFILENRIKGKLGKRNVFDSNKPIGKKKTLSKSKPTLNLVCSEHGKQECVGFCHAEIVLGCGCSFVNEKLEWRDARRYWFYRDFINKPRYKNS